MSSICQLKEHFRLATADEIDPPPAGSHRHTPVFFPPAEPPVWRDRQDSPWPNVRFDRLTNPSADAAIQANPSSVDGWREEDFDDLFSRFGTGGALTPEGAAEAIRAINLRRRLEKKLAALLETHLCETVANVIDALYREVALAGDDVFLGLDDSVDEDDGQPAEHASFSVVVVERPSGWEPSSWDAVPPAAKILHRYKQRLGRDRAVGCLFGVNSRALEDGLPVWACLVDSDSEVAVGDVCDEAISHLAREKSRDN